MKKAMIITVGTGRDVEHGIAFSIKQQNPDLLFFIYSKDSEKTIEKVKSLIEEHNFKIETRRYDEVDDVEKIYQEYSRYIDEVLSMGYAPNQIVADYTSGTKSMSAALVSAAIAKEIGNLSYIYGLRDDQGRVISNTERSSTLSPTGIFTEHKMKLFRQFFNRYQFTSAYELLNSADIHPNFKDIIKFYKQISSAYGEWDKFNFKKAFEKMDKIEFKNSELKKLAEIVKKHKQFLYQLKNSNEKGDLTDKDVVDLYWNAYRRYEEGKYDDCVSRLYRLVEMVAQIEFKKEFNTNTNCVSIELLPDDIKQKYHAENGRVKLALFDSYRVLKEKSQNKLAEKFYQNLEEIKKLLTVRNDSRLAHGIQPIEKEKAEKFLKFTYETFEIKEKIEFPKI